MVMRGERFLPEHAEAVKAEKERAAEHIEKTFGVDTEFFSQEKNKVVYDALCEVLAKADGKDKEFLTRFARAFFGKHSRANRESAAGGDEISRRNINAEDTPENIEERAMLDRVKENADTERSKKLQEMLNGECEILQGVRTRFGVTPSEQKPFSVIITGASNAPRWDKEANKPLPSEWDALIVEGKGRAPAAFVLRMPNGEQYLVLSQEEGRAILGERKDTMGMAAQHVRHEYLHTQRDLTVGQDLGHIFDEVMAGDAAQDTTHMSSRWLMHFLSESLEAQGRPSLWETFRESVVRDGGASFYKRFAEEFGNDALIAALAVKPISYEASTLIGEVPHVRGEVSSRMGDLFAVIVHGARQKYPNFTDHIRNRYAELPPEKARNRLAASAYQKFRFPPEWNEALELRAAEAD